MMTDDWQYRHPFWRSGVVSYFPFSPWPGEQVNLDVPDWLHKMNCGELRRVIFTDVDVGAWLPPRQCSCGHPMASHPLPGAIDGRLALHCPVCGRWEEDEDH